MRKLLILMLYFLSQDLLAQGGSSGSGPPSSQLEDVVKWIIENQSWKIGNGPDENSTFDPSSKTDLQLLIEMLQANSEAFNDGVLPLYAVSDGDGLYQLKATDPNMVEKLMNESDVATLSFKNSVHFVPPSAYESIIKSGAEFDRIWLGELPANTSVHLIVPADESDLAEIGYGQTVPH